MKQHIVLIGAIWLSCCAGMNRSYAAQLPSMAAEQPTNNIIKGTIVDENGDPIAGASK